MIWAQVKGYVGRNNKTFKLDEVHTLTESALSTITSDNWARAVRHVIEKEEKRLWELDGLAENMVERVVVDLQSTDSELSSSEEEADMSGIQPLPKD